MPNKIHLWFASESPAIIIKRKQFKGMNNQIKFEPEIPDQSTRNKNVDEYQYMTI